MTAVSISTDDSLRVMQHTHSDPKPLNVENVVTFLADQANSRSADCAKDLMLAQIKPDSMFMAGIGIQSLGYTFLLLQMYSELEVELMKNSTDQMALTTEMYKNMAKLEEKMAEDIKNSGFAKGLSQIAGAFASLGAAAYTMKQKNDILDERNKKIADHEQKYSITGTPVGPTDTAKAVGVMGETPASIKPSAPKSEPYYEMPPHKTPKAVPSDEKVHASGNTGDISADDAKKAAAAEAKKEEAAARKEIEDDFRSKLNEAGSLASLIGKSIDQTLQGIGTVVASGYDADRQVQEGLKHLVQMLIGNADGQKSRLQQQYEEAAKKMDEAIQAYNAAMNASH